MKREKKGKFSPPAQLVSENHCDAWVLQFVPVEATPAPTVLLRTPDGYTHQASSLKVCKLANGTLEGEVYGTKAYICRVHFLCQRSSMCEKMILNESKIHESVLVSSLASLRIISYSLNPSHVTRHH